MKEEQAKLPIPVEVVKDLLSKSLSRTFSDQVEVTDYTAERLSVVGRKSDVYRLDMHFNFPGRVFSLPPVVAAKFYLINYTKDPIVQSEIKIEYETEKKMLNLSDDLICRVGDKEIRVLPHYFSGKVDECNKYLAIIREFAPEEALSKIVLGKQEKQEDVHWTDINSTIFPLALLHIYDTWIRERVTLPQYGADWMSNVAVIHLRRIAHTKGRDLEEELAEEIKGGFMNIFTKYLSNHGLIKVINGDLNVSPRHATKSKLLDAGRSFIGPFTDDVALYSDPLFNNVLDSKDKVMGLYSRGKASIEDYINCYNTLAEILHYSEFPKGISKDFIMMSFLASALRGNLKGASASLVYGNGFLEKPGLTQKELQEASGNYALGVYDSIRLLKDLGDKEDKATLIKLDAQLQYAGLDFPYEHAVNRNQRCPSELIARHGKNWRQHVHPENLRPQQYKSSKTKQV